MSIVNGFQKGIGVFTESAKKGFNTYLLEKKIKQYKKENNEVYCKIGKLVYNSRSKGKPINKEELDGLCMEIRACNSKIKDLEKQISSIKSEEEVEPAKPSKAYEYELNYTTLNKSENDLKITRTNEGIRFLKFCLECQAGNEPEAVACQNCGHKFN